MVTAFRTGLATPQAGNAVSVTEQRTRQRWSATKSEPSFEDMAVKLRRVIIAARFQRPGVCQPQPEEARAVLLAWAAAAICSLRTAKVEGT